MPNTLIVMQCRTASKRLPGKALLPICNMPSVVLSALRAQKQGHSLVIATTKLPSDDYLCHVLSKNNIHYIRGCSDDVLGRFVLASKHLKDTDIVIRLTADNVFPDGDFIKELVEGFLSQNRPYCTTNSVHNGFPYGLGAEIFYVEALRQANKHANTSFEREHVTPWMINNIQGAAYQFEDKYDLANVRCTLDTLEDYLSLVELFQDILDPIQTSWQSLCQMLKEKVEGKTKSVSCEYPISHFTLGTAQLGIPYGVTNQQGLPNELEASQVVKTAIARGVVSFDCARGYGVAEQRLGNSLQDIQNIEVITKLDPSIDTSETSKQISNSVRASVFESCYRLKRERLDAVLVHRFHHYQNPAVWEVLCELKAQGVIGNLGLSVNSVREAINAIENEAITYIQLPFNILDWRWEKEDLPSKILQRNDLKVFARSIFLQGLLSASIDKWPEKFAAIGQEIIPVLEKLVIRTRRLSVIDLCLAYVKAKPWIDQLVIGCLDEQQLCENLDVFKSPALSLEQCQMVNDSIPLLPEEFLNPTKW